MTALEKILVTAGSLINGTTRDATDPTQAKQLIKRILFNGTVVFLLLLCSRAPVAEPPTTSQATSTSCLYDGKAYGPGAVLHMGVPPGVNQSCYPNGWWATGPSTDPARWTPCVWNSQNYSPGALLVMYPGQKLIFSCSSEGAWR